LMRHLNINEVVQFLVFLLTAEIAKNAEGWKLSLKPLRTLRLLCVLCGKI
jgi:hypothetical protein